MPEAPSPHPVESTGNGCVLVLCDRSQPEASHLPEVALAALSHVGIPYRLWDLSRTDLAACDLSAVAAVLVAQEHLGRCLRARDIGTILDAVERDGMGLVNLDHDLAAYGDELLSALGLQGIGPSRRLIAGGTASVIIPEADHFITYTQSSGAHHTLRTPAPTTAAAVTDPDTRILAVSDQGSPLLLARRRGGGRIVQWLISPKLWTRPYLGHAHGLDDLFWKGIVWASRKPLAALSMPPFVRLRFDDCNGLWQHAQDFEFVDVLNEFGHIPTLCLCVRALAPDGAEKAHALARWGRAEFAPHTLAPGLSIFYGTPEREYTLDELHAILNEVDDHFRRWGIAPSQILSDHDHECSVAALPLLKARGIRYKMNITLPGERWGGVHYDWRPAPYGSMSYALDYLPGSKDFFVVFNHYPTFDYARAYLPDGRHFLYNRTGGYGEYMWDFLNGLTRGPDRETSDIEAAARRLADHTTLGLNSLFFGGSITHSHFSRALSPGEWRALLSRFESLTSRHKKIYARYDAIAEYAQAKVDSHLAHVAIDGRAGTIRCTIVGQARVALQLAVFRDAGEAVREDRHEIPPFTNRADLTIP